MFVANHLDVVDEVYQQLDGEESVEVKTAKELLKVNRPSRRTFRTDGE